MQTGQVQVRASTSRLKLNIAPQQRFHVIDLTECFAAAGDLLRRHRRALFCSFHTTAGYLEQSLAVRLDHHRDRVSAFFDAFRTLFPEGAEYSHDRMELRSELSEEQKAVESRNGDSHLMFIGSGMKNCVTYRTVPANPVYFIDLDGVTAHSRRERQTMIVGYNRERLSGRLKTSVPVAESPIDCVNLADHRFGLMDEISQLIHRSGIEHGRIDITMQAGERNAGVIVNEYETLLVENDLSGVLNNPMKFTAESESVADSLRHAFRIEQASFERLKATIKTPLAKRVLRSRRASFLASNDSGDCVRLLRGIYQSPILVQWNAAPGCIRHLNVTLTELL